jgi:hypothetical protein
MYRTGWARAAKKEKVKDMMHSIVMYMNKSLTEAFTLVGKQLILNLKWRAVKYFVTVQVAGILV